MNTLDLIGKVVVVLYKVYAYSIRLHSFCVIATSKTDAEKLLVEAIVAGDCNGLSDLNASLESALEGGRLVLPDKNSEYKLKINSLDTKLLHTTYINHYRTYDPCRLSYFPLYEFYFSAGVGNVPHIHVRPLDAEYALQKTKKQQPISRTHIQQFLQSHRNSV